MAKTTLLILTYNRCEEALRTIARALALPERPPVIVVDNASTDGTSDTVRARFPQVRLVRASENLGAAARNLGVRAARTPYVAFSDDDTSWCGGSIAKGEEILDAYPRIAALNARVVVGSTRRLDPACAAMAASPLPAPGLPGPALMGFLAGATMFRRDAFLEAGGYERRFFIGGEEALLAYDLVRAGWHIVYMDAMTVVHEPSRLRDAAARSVIQARNELWLAWMRRRASSAWRITARALRDAGGRRALVCALPGLPWAVSHRRPLPPEWERWRVRLDRQEIRKDAAKAHRIGIHLESRDAEEAERSQRTQAAFSARGGRAQRATTSR